MPIFILKKIITFSFLFILCANIIGVQVVYFFCKMHSNSNIDNRIINADLSQLEKVTFSLKLPVKLPYMPAKFENEFTGEWEFKGNVYRFIKSKIINNTVYYECVTNKEGKIMLKAFAEEISKNSDSKGTSKKAGKSLNFNFLKNYLSSNTNYQLHLGVFLKKEKYSTYKVAYTKDFFIKLPVPPPDIHC